MEAMWTRFLPHIAQVREWLAAGELGELVTVTADHGQWFAEDPGFRLFAPELGGGALLDLGIYPVSFASMILGAPNRIAAVIDPAFTGVDAQTSMIFGYESGAQAVLTCTLRAKSPTRASIVGTDARIEIDGDFYAPATVTLLPRDGEPTRIESTHQGRGLRHQADEVARRLAAGDLESPLMRPGRVDLDHEDDGRGAGAGPAELSASRDATRTSPTTAGWCPPPDPRRDRPGGHRPRAARRVDRRLEVEREPASGETGRRRLRRPGAALQRLLPGQKALRRGRRARHRRGLAVADRRQGRLARRLSDLPRTEAELPRRRRGACRLVLVPARLARRRLVRHREPSASRSARKAPSTCRPTRPEAAGRSALPIKARARRI